MVFGHRGKYGRHGWKPFLAALATAAVLFGLLYLASLFQN